MTNAHSVSEHGRIAKCLTGIRGLDQITGGGVPRNRPTLLCGGPGAGKSLLAAEFLARGSRQFGEPGVLVTFDETSRDVIANVASLGFDLEDLIT